MPSGSRKKTFRYKLPSRARPREDISRPEPHPDEELNLTGVVRGKKASDLEEVFARALDKSPQVIWWKREQLYGMPARNMSGAVTLDFMVYTGSLYPIQIDDEWVHKGADAEAHDKIQDQRLDILLRPQGARPVLRIPGNKLREGRKASQEKADTLVGEMFT